MNKTITSKISVLLLLTLFAFQVQGQALWTTDGTYKLSTSGVSPELYMTINNDGDLEWAAELPNDDPSQVWTIKGHRYAAVTHGTPSTTGAYPGEGYMEVTATIPGRGNFTMATATQSNPAVLIARPGDPINTGDTSDVSGLDQFQRRKTKVDSDGLKDSTGTLPEGNNMLFIKTPWSEAFRYGTVPTAAGEQVKFIKSDTVLQFHLIAALSTEDFDTSSVFISNPVNNELNIEGLTANVKQVSVYSLLGKQVLSKNVNQQATLSFDVSALSTGMYLVKMQGDKGSFVHKIVKQ